MYYFICTNRDAFSETLANLIIEEPSHSFQFIGKNGVGKEYVINKIEQHLKKKFDIYRVVSDSLMRKNQHIATHSFNIAFSLSHFVGMSLVPVKNDSLKINYIISNLKAMTLKRRIIISALDYDILPTESREFIAILLCNKKMIEEKVKKKIVFIITSNTDYFDGIYNVKNIIFKDYTRKDIYDYLINTCGYTTSQISNEKLNQICKLCGSNLNLVRDYAKLILEISITPNTLESIVDTKLNFYIQTGFKYNLSKDELKSIIYASSMSIHLLTPEMIGYINRINIDCAEKGFECAVNENFLEKEHPLHFPRNNNFLFVSQEEKEYLYQQAKTTYLGKIPNYYLYLSDIAEDEYFERSQYLLQYYGEVNKNVFALIVLALSKSFLLNDLLIRNKVTSFFYDNCTKNYYVDIFDQISNAYQENENRNYKKSNDILVEIDYSELNVVLVAELRRLEFKNSYLGRIATQQKLNSLSNKLQTHLEQQLTLTTEFLSKSKEEKILSLRIIFELAPFILDSQNDKETFRKLYDKSLILVKYINNHFIKKSFADYVINVFNRKAFLFAPPSNAALFYEQSVAYFRENSIWNEYIIALASKAGNEIALHEYSKAIKSCKTAISTMEKEEIEVPQKEKIYNNLYIAEFLLFESQESSFNRIQRKAINVAIQLEKLLTERACGTNHVILTNIASLYLYADREKEYNQFKKRLENSLRCKDVSSVKNININDFYRYHFAWYEFYLNLKKGNWKQCSQIINSLNSFYPAIFHNYKKMDLRVEAARYLIKRKCIPNARKYGLNMLQYAPSDKKYYSSRGLPLSDLQYTSWE